MPGPRRPRPVRWFSWYRRCWASAPGAALLAALALGGCPGDVGRRCRTADDCGIGQVCAAGRCVVPEVPIDGGDPLDVGGQPVDGAGGPDTTCSSSSFKLTETQVTFQVPARARYMHVKAWGAGGNGEGQCTGYDDGGIGGFSEGVFSVTQGDPLLIIVGQRGRAGMTGEERMRFGFGDWGGGGLSGVFRGSTSITAADSARALIIAGGGGSAGAPGCHPGGTGNHPTAGGMTSMQGGVGADQINGGAGGYAGGKGGAKGEAAKGGTGYVATSALKSSILYVAPGAGAPPRTKDPDYDGSAGKTETAGRVVIHFVCSVPPLQ